MLFVKSMSISISVLLGCSAFVLLLITVLSKKAEKPIAESYEKQKQFITNVNHELKTPLTLILANLDIAETELGKNEWLDDIRYEGYRMSELVNQLVQLSRMDEEQLLLEKEEINISVLLNETTNYFLGLAEQKQIKLLTDIEENIIYNCDEKLIRKLFSILLDNALKYCDKSGQIQIKLIKKKNIFFTIENTYSDIETVELSKLFDRFYRSDKARTFTGGYGIGLSIAKSIVQKHHGDINAYEIAKSKIGFKVILR